MKTVNAAAITVTVGSYVTRSCRVGIPVTAMAQPQADWQTTTADACVMTVTWVQAVRLRDHVMRENASMVSPLALRSRAALVCAMLVGLERLATLQYHALRGIAPAMVKQWGPSLLMIVLATVTMVGGVIRAEIQLRALTISATITELPGDMFTKVPAHVTAAADGAALNAQRRFPVVLA